MSPEHSVVLVLSSKAAVNVDSQGLLVEEGRQLAAAAVLAAMGQELGSVGGQPPAESLRRALAAELRVQAIRVGTIHVDVLVQDAAVRWASAADEAATVKVRFPAESDGNAG